MRSGVNGLKLEDGASVPQVVLSQQLDGSSLFGVMRVD